MKIFLKKNKIYFEIFELLFLGLMGIVVSITQIRISRNELQIHKNELLPLIRVDYDYIKNDSLNFYDTKVVRISNEGKQLRNFEYNFEVLYNFEIIKKNKKKRNEYIPISDFYFVRFSTNNFDNKLVEAFTIGNNKEYGRVYNECMKLTKDENYIFVNEIELFQLSYVDINETKHIDYFCGNKKITKAEYDKTISLINPKYKNLMLRMDDITSMFIQKL